MLEFGGIIFWGIVLVLTLWELGVLYNDEFGWAYVPLIAFIILFFATTEKPQIDLRYLALWPLASIAWLPIYWYISLKRKASKIKNAIKEWPSRKDVYSLGIEDIAFKEDDKIKVKHPTIDELMINSIMAPMSAPLFVFESWVEAFVSYIKNVMDKVRDSISEGINQ